MYYIYGQSGPSLLIESTDSMIYYTDLYYEKSKSSKVGLSVSIVGTKTIFCQKKKKTPLGGPKMLKGVHIFQ